ncbi:hypothetical protein [Brevundimonas sp. Root1279]|uniref:hypothetical protein n=1 Tax=Brevundimonas sp. Root1279 TaxID=1736443 RepID=UPI0006F7C65A|nr:hypothetical protein [Brevundimonas sp. Root1279]KQW78881.1 hypothetical protein ASC65_16380 [Brevundimonas sp. Root1279]
MVRDPHDAAPVPAEDPTLPTGPEGSPAELAMVSRQRLTGSATGVGSVDFDDPGAFDVGADDHHPEDESIVDLVTRPQP